MDAAALGQALYEAEVAVATKASPPSAKFAAWAELPKHARDRRIAQAEQLLGHYEVKVRG